ncbi:MAG: N-acetylmannosamine-6-phosphate 2-epimerase [Mycoplasmatales bacterium]
MIKKNSFIVSCQALEDEPLHSSFIMGRLALAAKLGGADGIRANSVQDILEIKKMVDLPIIGIIKIDYEDSLVYITPTMKEIDELYEIGVEVIALDATNRIRPQKKQLKEFFNAIKKKYPNQKLMADCSTFEEMYEAEKLGFDYLGTTLFGYTDYSKVGAFEDINNFKEKVINLKTPIIGEGQISSPELAKKVKDLGVFAIVVGGAITRPQEITKNFIKVIKKEI